MGKHPISGRERIGPFDTTIDADYCERYADAVRSNNSRYRDGSAVPPLAIAAQIFQGQWAAMDSMVPSMLEGRPRGGVHGSHDVRIFRPIRVGEPLVTYVEPHSARPFKDNARVVTRHVTVDVREQPVVEQLWTTVLFSVSCPVVGPDAPDHAFPDSLRSQPILSSELEVDEEMTRLYAEVSEDFSAHHFDLEAARAGGFDRVFLHGLCSLALCAEAAVEGPAGGAPERVTRVAGRFTSPAFLGQALRIEVFDAMDGAYALEATGGSGAKVISHGRVELGGTAQVG